jgi:hypothetical protein
MSQPLPTEQFQALGGYTESSVLKVPERFAKRFARSIAGAEAADAALAEYAAADEAAWETVIKPQHYGVSNGLPVVVFNPQATVDPAVGCDITPDGQLARPPEDARDPAIRNAVRQAAEDAIRRREKAERKVVQANERLRKLERQRWVTTVDSG